MKIDEHIKNLEEYCQDDIDFRSQTAEEEKSDFDIFCDNHIADIKAVIEELKNKDKEIEYWKEQAEGYSGLAEQIKEDFENRDRWE